MQRQPGISRPDRAFFTALAVVLLTVGSVLGAVAATDNSAVPSARGEQSDSGNGFTQLAAEHRCLTEVIYYEARGESERGQLAVAEVVLHRLAAGGYGKSICQVVYEGSSRDTGCQFSFTCNGDMDRPRETLAWNKAGDVAAKILTREIELPDATDGATNYHAVWVSPVWAPTLKKTTRIGNHIFYRADSSES